jgi:ribosomal protein S1
LEIDIVVLEIDKEGRKLSLGHKQIEENPWDTFETVFPVGSYHEVVIVRRDDKGAIVQLPYGLEAYAPIKHMRKEDGSIASVEETLTVKVLEFNRDDKRILVSHQRYLEDIRREADDVVRRDERKDVEQTERIMQSQNTRVEKATLGELDVFSQLKEQLQQGNNTDARVEEKKEESVKAEPVVEAPAPEAEESAPVAEEKVTPAPVEAAKKAAVAPVKKAKEAAVAKVEAPVEEKKKSPKVAKEAAKPKAKSAKGDDLKKIEGVGPKIAEILGAAGVDSFAKVADTSVDDLKTILESAGSRYKMFDPTTWPEQAKLAAAGDWDGLKALQGELSGGRR